MHNIKDIRNNFDNFKNLIKSRNVSIDLDEILDLDKKNRKLIQEKETLEQEKKSISKKQDKSLFAKSKEISEKIIAEIVSRLSFLNNVGLTYLSLDRSAETLSGGEAQRIRLASQIGSGLVGVMYILDEPSIGLHQRDNDKLLKTLKDLKALGNTVIVVEHDEDTILASDHIIDVGPGAGDLGGKIVYAGEPVGIKKSKSSLTGWGIWEINRPWPRRGTHQRRSDHQWP